VYPKGANSLAASGLISRNDLVGTRRAPEQLRNSPTIASVSASGVNAIAH